MRTLSFYAVLLFSIFTTTQSIAQNSVSKESFNVWGNCGMCKKTIERSAKTAGAATASWNEETKQLAISFAANKTTSSKIQEAIAKAGYDTRDFVADNKAYNSLPVCCRYERKTDTTTKSTDKASDDIAPCCKDMSACKEMVACKDMACCKM